MTGLAGDDTLENTSTLTVNAWSRTLAGSITLNLADSASANADVIATSNATGLAGGDMQDTVRNNARLDVLVNTATDSDHASYVFAGGHGQLRIDGDATIDPGSAIIVVAGRQRYVDGQTFDVLVADTVTGAFDDETLPASRFLSANVNYPPEAVQIEMEVTPFTTVARRNPVQSGVSAYLDRIAPVRLTANLQHHDTLVSPFLGVA